MTELLMCAKCEDGEIVEFYLQNLLDAKWNTSGKTLRLPASDYGDISIYPETIQASSDAGLREEVEKLRADLSVSQDQNCEYLAEENKRQRQNSELAAYYNHCQVLERQVFDWQQSGTKMLDEIMKYKEDNERLTAEKEYIQANLDAARNGLTKAVDIFNTWSNPGATAKQMLGECEEGLFHSGGVG